MSRTTPTMTCEVFSQRLMDFLEGDLDGATRAAMEAHARQCAACGALLADLRLVSAQAANLPVVSPSRDLWSGIAERIEAPVVALADRRPLWKSPRVLGFAAAAAIVLAAALGYESARSTTPDSAAVTAPRQVATLPPALSDSVQTVSPAEAVHATVRGTTDSVRASLAANRAANATPDAVEKTYDGEINGLRAIIKQRRSQLDTTTVKILERNLAVIDSAIAQCKTALAKDPHSQFLIQSLNQSLDTKVQILRMTAALPSAT
jgi:hypothetical protein